MDYPIAGCKCNGCEAARAERMKVRPFLGILGNYNRPAEPEPQSVSPHFVTGAEAEPAPEPVYTLVLVDYFEDDTPDDNSCELHTAESLIEAIVARRDHEGRYKVYKLGTMVLDVIEVE